MMLEKAGCCRTSRLLQSEPSGGILPPRQAASMHACMDYQRRPIVRSDDRE
jgi:hypothetical protein